MLVWAVFIFVFLSFSSHFALWDIVALSQDMHELCLQKLNFKAKFEDLYKALVCGKRLPGGQIKNLFVEGGLIHLAVVSGAHLFFLEKLWRTLPLPKLVKSHGIFIVLLLYALASQLYPPVVRALFSFILFRLSYTFKLFWNPCLVILLSGVLCLIYQPSWVYSLSLQLSLLACLLYHSSNKALKKCFLIYIFTFPIINRWQSLHPFTIFINWLLAPLVSSLLFPLTILSPFFSFLYPLTDGLWSLVFKFLKLFQFISSNKLFLTKWYLPENWIWFYVSGVCVISLFYSLIKRNLLNRKPEIELIN